MFSKSKLRETVLKYQDLLSGNIILLNPLLDRVYEQKGGQLRIAKGDSNCEELGSCLVEGDGFVICLVPEAGMSLL